MSRFKVGRTIHGNLQKYESGNPLQQRLIDRFHQQVVGLLRRTDADYLLDAGCGEAFGLAHLQDAGLDAACFGCDVSFEALRYAREHVLPELPSQVATLEALPYADGAFPLVICLEVLEHVPDSRVALQELARVSSGYLLLSVPHEPFFRALNFLRGKHLARWGNDPEHLHNYSGRAFVKMVGQVVDVVWHGYSFPWQIILARKRDSE